MGRRRGQAAGRLLQHDGGVDGTGEPEGGMGHERTHRGHLAEADQGRAPRLQVAGCGPGDALAPGWLATIGYAGLKDLVSRPGPLPPTARDDLG